MGVVGVPVVDFVLLDFLLEDTVVSWASGPDLFSEDCPYEELKSREVAPDEEPDLLATPGRSTFPSAPSKAYVSLDPLWEPGGPRIVGGEAGSDALF